MGKMKARQMEIDEVLDKLREAWYRLPSQRLAQLIDNALRRGPYQGSAFYYPDDQLVKDLDNFVSEVVKEEESQG